MLVCAKVTHNLVPFTRCLCDVCVSGSVPGIRPAEAGEFTRRAFQAGKLGLTEVGEGNKSIRPDKQGWKRGVSGQ